MGDATFWNGKPCPCRRLRVRLPDSYDGPETSPWFGHLLGQEIDAVDVDAVLAVVKAALLSDEAVQAAARRFQPSDQAARRIIAAAWESMTGGEDLPDMIRGFTPAEAREEYVRVATDAVCAFDPQAAEYRMRTEAWVRVALTAAWAKEGGE